MMRALCLRALKCGSGKRKNSVCSWAFWKKFGRNFIALPRITEMFWNPPGVPAICRAVPGSVFVSVFAGPVGAIGDTAIGSSAAASRNALIRSVTYWVTCARISIPIVDNQ